MYTIVFEHSDFVVINKHPNVHFHSQDGNAGVIAQLAQELAQPLFPVHRLDTITSGVLVVAKSSEAAAKLAREFRERSTQKYYLALATGKPKKKQGLIKGGMQKARRSQWKLTKSTENVAITQFFSHSVGAGLRAYLLKPHTGKTHQLRVALKSLGTPILGDELYGGEAADRGYLHAWQLAFEFDGAKYRFCADLTHGDWAERIIQALPAEWQAPHELSWPAL